MYYREFAPAPEVSGIVARYWMLDTLGVSAGFQHRVLPDGCTDLVLARRDPAPVCVVRGPRDTPLQVAVGPGERFWGSRLWPDAAPAVLGVPAERLIGAVEPALPLLGAPVRELAADLAAAEDDAAAVAVLDGWWGGRLAPAPRVDAAVRLAVLTLHAGGWELGTERLARLVCLSPRQLQRRFRAATGLTVKTYARIRRLRGAVGQLVAADPPGWGRIAAALGFADQSHLAAEFARLAGARPTEVARYVASIRHRDVLA